MFKKYIIIIVLIIFVIAGFVRINMINTKALSPLGTTEDNFSLVSETFGEEFEEFIMDKSSVKIYNGDEADELATIKILDKEINLTKNNIFFKAIDSIVNFTNKTIVNIRGKFNEITKNKNDNSESNKNDNLKNIIDDFIKNKDNN